MPQRSSLRRRVALGAASLLVAGGVFVAAAPADALSISSTIPNPDGVGTVAVSQDGTRAYISNPSGEGIRSIDLDSRTVEVLPFDSAGRYGSSAVSPDGKVLYFDDSTSGVLYAYDIAREDATELVGAVSSYNMSVSPDGGKVYISSDFGLAIVDVATDTQTLLPIRTFDRVVFSADGATGYVAGGDQTVRVIDTATGTERDTISTPGYAGFTDITADGKTIYTVDSDGVLYTIDTATRAVETKGQVGSTGSLTLSPDGLRLYTNDFNSSQLRVFDVSTLTNVGNIPLQDQYAALTVDPDGLTGYTVAGTSFPDFVFVDLRENSVLTAESPSTSATTGQPYSYQFAASGRPAPAFTYAGDLPVGLTLTSEGLLSGVPTVPGSYTFIVSATNSLSRDSTVPITITVAGIAPEFVDASPSTSATVGTAYDYMFTATGTPAPTFSVEGTLPAGVTLSEDGVLSGTPTTPGSFTFQVVASNGVDPDAVTDPITITVAASGTPTPTPTPTPTSSTSPSPSPSASPSQGGSLASTGVDASMPLWAGFAIIAVGAALLTARRVRRSR